MQNRFFCAWISAFFAIVFFTPAFCCTVKDDTGELIHLDRAAKRIVSLAPDLTETLFAIGAGGQIIGVISGSDYPKSAQHLPQIAAYNSIDLERIMSLHPDLIITWGKNFSRPLSILKNRGVQIYIAAPKRLEDIPRTMNNLACLTGTEKIAAQQVNQFNKSLARIRKKYRFKKPVTVFYQIGAYSLFTINQESWIDQVLSLCGGKNIFAQAKLLTGEVGLEAVLVANPQVIMSDARTENWRKPWQKWPQMTAVKQQFLFTIDPDLIERAGPRVLLGTEKICQLLQAAR